EGAAAHRKPHLLPGEVPHRKPHLLPGEVPHRKHRPRPGVAAGTPIHQTTGPRRTSLAPIGISVLLPRLHECPMVVKFSSHRRSKGSSGQSTLTTDRFYGSRRWLGET